MVLPGTVVNLLAVALSFFSGTFERTMIGGGGKSFMLPRLMRKSSGMTASEPTTFTRICIL
jgi:hypothetical protein